MATRSASSSASSWSWVTKMVVTPVASWMAAKLAAQRFAHRGVQRAEGLVEQQHLGRDRQRTRQRHPLALAAGELVGEAFAQAVELDQLEQLVDAPVDLFALSAACRRVCARPDRRRRSCATLMCLKRAYCWKTKPTWRAAAWAKVTSSPSNSTSAAVRKLQPGDQCATAWSCPTPTVRAAPTVRRPRISRLTPFSAG